MKTFGGYKRNHYLCTRFQGTTLKALNNGSVAQLNRASDYGSEGCRFESCRSHSKEDITSRNVLFFVIYAYDLKNVLTRLCYTSCYTLYNTRLCGCVTLPFYFSFIISLHLVVGHALLKSCFMASANFLPFGYCCDERITVSVPSTLFIRSTALSSCIIC